MSSKRSSSKAFDSSDDIENAGPSGFKRHAVEKKSRKRTALNDSNLQDDNKSEIPLKRSKFQKKSEGYSTYRLINHKVPVKQPVKPAPFVDPEVVASGDFGSLPVELIENIFGFLKNRSKLNLAASCKRMNRIISNPSIVKNLVCTIDLDNAISKLERPYQKAIIKNMKDPESLLEREHLVSFLKKVGLHLMNVSFSSCQMSQFWAAEVLSSFSKITSLKFHKCQIIPSNEFNAPALAHLRRFTSNYELMGANLQLLRRVRTLVRFTTSSFSATPEISPSERHVNKHEESDSESDDDDDDEFRDNYSLQHVVHQTLERQKSLKKLSIFHVELFSYPFVTDRFQLTKLVLFIARLNDIQSLYMLEFLQQQPQIKQVTLNVRPNDSIDARNFHESLVHILRLQSLMKLKIVFYNTSEMQMSFRNSGVVNPNVVDLYMSVREHDHRYKRFVDSTAKMFPNLGSLHMKMDYEWINREMTSDQTFESMNSLKKLTSLAFEGSASDLITAIKSPSLKHFAMLDCRRSNQDDWKTFFENNSNIQMLSVSFRNCLCCNGLQSVIRAFEFAVLLLRQAVNITFCLGIHVEDVEIETYLRDYAIENGSTTLKTLIICNEIFNL